jgi:dGTPase
VDPLRAKSGPISQAAIQAYGDLPPQNRARHDRDRIVHARAFRRLEAKTQVFTPGLCDHFRNRLTHTIEVAQIAHTVAAVLALDEDLTEALALAHDIGHPPFSYAGEEALDCQMKRFGARFARRHRQAFARFRPWRKPRFGGVFAGLTAAPGGTAHRPGG